MKKLLVGTLYLTLFVLAFLVVESAQRQAHHARALIEQDSPKEAVNRATRELLEQLTFGWYDGAADARRDREFRELHRDLAGQETDRWSLVTASLAALALSWFLIRWLICHDFSLRRTRRRQFAAHLGACAGVGLFVGILAPLLTISASHEVPTLGRVVISYETKSLLGTVSVLVAKERWLLAALLALFSFIVPVAKTAGTIWLAITPPENSATSRVRHVRQALHWLGKWSMTDVFVVAVLVVFFTANSSGPTDAALGIGVYFFVAYTVANLVAGQLVEKDWLGDMPQRERSAAGSP